MGFQLSPVAQMRSGGGVSVQRGGPPCMKAGPRSAQDFAKECCCPKRWGEARSQCCVAAVVPAGADIQVSAFDSFSTNGESSSVTLVIAARSEALRRIRSRLRYRGTLPTPPSAGCSHETGELDLEIVDADRQTWRPRGRIDDARADAGPRLRLKIVVASCTTANGSPLCT